jgi:outer membrane receptor protein involved in Fe transport
MRLGVVATAVSLSIVGLSMAADVQAAINRVHIDIPTQGLGSALRTLAKEHNFQIVYASKDVSSLRSHGAVGEYTVDEALTHILSGTGLTFRYLDQTTVTIVPTGPSALSSSEGRTKAEAEDSGAKDGLSDKDQRAPRSFWDRFRLAQADQGRVANDGSVTRGNPQTTAEGRVILLDEVVVTGTHIRGEPPVGAAVKVYTHEDLTQSGAATVDQFARQMVENFTSADTVANPNTNIGYARLNGAGINNGFLGAAIDLHGVGPSATLTLLNGHRMATGGYDGSLADISQIPLSAVDHIEVLADGASAVYGADAVAGVVNIVMRKDFSGAETALRYGSATQGGAAELTGSQLLGGSWGGGNAFLNYEYNRQNALDASNRDYIPDLHGPDLLVPQNKRNSVFLSGSQELGAQTTISADVMYTKRDFFNQNTFYSTRVQSGSLFDGTVKTTGASVTLDRALFADWHASLTGSYSKLEQDNHETDDAHAGAFSQHVDAFSHIDSGATGADLLATGSLFALPGGAVKAAVGTSYRGETFQATTLQVFNSFSNTFSVPEVQRHVASVSAEFIVPIVGASNAVPGIQRLQFSAAGRYDHYSDFGSTTNPRLGLVWEPVIGFDMRGSYGKSFRAPLLNQLNGPQNANANPYPDPAAPAGFQDMLILNGGNPNLQPEHSTSYTAGFDIKPQGIPSFTFGATYFHIDFSDRIATPPVVGINYFHDPALAPFLTLNPSLAQVQAIFNSPAFLGDQAGLGAAGVTAIFDSRSANMATSKVSGVDLSTSYGLATAYGHFDISASVAHLTHNDFQPTSATPSTPLLNTFGEPTKWKGRSSVAWRKVGFSAMFSLNYVGSYENTLFTPPTDVSSWVTGDLYLSYALGAMQSDLLNGLRVALSATNLTDKTPPYAPLPPTSLRPGQVSIPYDSANASPVGRVIALQVSKRW